MSRRYLKLGMLQPHLQMAFKEFLSVQSTGVDFAKGSPAMKSTPVEMLQEHSFAVSTQNEESKEHLFAFSKKTSYICAKIDAL